MYPFTAKTLSSRLQPGTRLFGQTFVHATVVERQTLPLFVRSVQGELSTSRQILPAHVHTSLELGVIAGRCWQKKNNQQHNEHMLKMKTIQLAQFNYI